MQQTTGTSNQEQHLRAQLELLQNHDADSSGARDARAAPSHSPPARAANGYDELAAASHDAARAIAVKTEAESHIHPDLRAAPGHGAPAPNMMPMAPPSGHSPGTSPAPPQNASIAPAPPVASPDQGSSADGRKAKRELSQSKRAAQNRAAQRAFRQRKEGYIKKLEQQVREYGEMEQTFKAMQTENYALREAAPGDPNNNPAAGTPLEAVAQAVAGLQEQMDEDRQAYANRAEEDTRTAEEINRQLQPEEGVARAE
ncbi:hypothetical protein ACCO45_011105 [Purpureocillium lilacinum]|uniref:Uncharacterized protein n=1 Tax=Purpureocillium lilacinum TaxID=33203 RepID=A0ACC4DHC8_PURLI